jgi:hypothetical protein
MLRNVITARVELQSSGNNAELSTFLNKGNTEDEYHQRSREIALEGSSRIMRTV